MKKGILNIAMGVVLLLSLLSLKLLGSVSNPSFENVEAEPIEGANDSEVGELKQP